MITQSVRSMDHYQKQSAPPIRPSRSSSSANKPFQHPDLQTFERIGPLTVTNSRADAAVAMETLLAKATVANPAFLMACKRGDEPTVRSFILRKINEEMINYQDCTGRTGLSYICSDGQMGLLHTVSESPDLDINLADNEGNTPLMLAAQAGHAEIVAHILDRFRGTVEIDQRNEFGMTALMKSSLQGRSRCVKLLLSAGANPMLRDPNRRYTALDWAKYCGRQCCIEAIEKFIKSNPKRYSSKYDSKIVAASSAAARNRRTSESELGSEYLLLKHQQLSKSDSENSWLRQKLRKTLRHESKSKKDLGPLGNMTATAMMCASSAIFTNIEDTSGTTLGRESSKRPYKPLPLLVPKLEITQAPALVTEFDLLLESESKSTKISLERRKRN